MKYVICGSAPGIEGYMQLELYTGWKVASDPALATQMEMPVAWIVSEILKRMMIFSGYQFFLEEAI